MDGPEGVENGKEVEKSSQRTPYNLKDTQGIIRNVTRILKIPMDKIICRH